MLPFYLRYCLPKKYPVFFGGLGAGDANIYKYYDIKLSGRVYSCERQINVEVEIKGRYAIITCIVENQGRKRIIPQNVYLFIDQGNIEANCANFPFLLMHEKGDYDCVLAKKCKAGGINSFPKEILPTEYEHNFHKSFKLRHLSTDSILFIDPGEKFSEDVIIEFPKAGVYRTTVIWTAVNADCICTTKQFVIQG